MQDIGVTLLNVANFIEPSHDRTALIRAETMAEEQARVAVRSNNALATGSPP